MYVIQLEDPPTEEDRPGRGGPQRIRSGEEKNEQDRKRMGNVAFFQIMRCSQLETMLWAISFYAMEGFISDFMKRRRLEKELRNKHRIVNEESRYSEHRRNNYR